MIIYLIGAPGVGKTTVKKLLIKKERLSNSHILVDPYRIFCKPIKSSVERFLYPSSQYHTDFIHKILHFVFYRIPSVTERLDTFSKVESKWKPFLNSWFKCLADEQDVTIRSIVDQIELLQVRAWVELCCPENACVIMDESLCNRQDFFSNTEQGIRNAREYFKNVPCPDAIVLLDSRVDLILERLEQRRAQKNWVNFRHRGMTAEELCRESQWSIKLARMCLQELGDRNIPCFVVNADNAPEVICKRILAFLNEEFRLNIFDR